MDKGTKWLDDNSKHYPSKEYLKDLVEYFPGLVSYPRAIDIIENFDKNNEF